MLDVIIIALRILGVLCILAAVSEASKRGRQDVADLAAGLFFAVLAWCIGGLAS